VIKMYRENVLQFMERRKKTLFIPKNGGLYSYVITMLPEIGLDIVKEIVKRKSGEATGNIEVGGGGLEIVLARGEDIPRRVAEYNRQGKPAYGLTGDDLFDEYQLSLRGRTDAEDRRLAVLNTYDWFDENAEFRKPALCLMAKTERLLENVPMDLRVAVNGKYKLTSREYLRKKFPEIRRLIDTTYNGDTESTVSDGTNDCCVEIVYSGNTREENGLKVLDPVRFSDIVLIGPNPNFLGAMIAMDYRRVAARRNCPSTKSYTASLLDSKKLRRDKLISEAAEVFSAMEGNGDLGSELSDLLYAINVVMVGEGVTPQQVADKIQRKL
jgi:phosphoribosyl-ATP pyrophosphohydrolase